MRGTRLTRNQHARPDGSSGSPRSASCLTRRPRVCSPFTGARTLNYACVRCTTPGSSGTSTIPNRVVLAPLAGIGNWFVRLQAKRYGAGLAVSRDGLELRDPLRQREDARRAAAGRTRERRRPVAIQLFGHDPEIMRSRRRRRSRRVGADIIDLNMGCPVPKVMKTGAGAALIKDPDTAVAVAARRARGLRPAGHREAARVASSRAACEGSSSPAGSSRRPASPGITLPPAPRRRAPQGRARTTTSPRELVRELPVPVIVSGGMDGAEHIRWVFEHTGCAAVMLARGALGNPWLFAQVLGARDDDADARGGRSPSGAG